MASKAKSDVKVLKGQDGAHLYQVLLVNNDPPYMLSCRKAENKVLDYIKRVLSNTCHSTFSSSSPLLDKPPIRCRRHLRQSEGRRPQNSHAKDPYCARRKGRAHAENIRYSFLSRVSHHFPYICANVIRKSHIFRREPGKSRCASGSKSQGSCGRDRDAQRTQ